MATVKCVALLTVLLSPYVFAGDNPTSLSSRYEVQQHLFNSGEVSVPLTPFPDQGLSQKKSKGLAAIYSLLLPGMGELYGGEFGSGKYFMIAEGVLWLTYATFEIQGNQLRDDSRAFAQAHAGVTTSGKDDQYFIDIGNFLNIDEYNDKKLRDRDPLKLYDPGVGYAWSWDSDVSRSSFRSQRITSENMYNNRKFVAAAILINHVGSAINAVRAVISHNNAIDEALGGFDVHADVMGSFSHPHGIVVTMTKSF